jgi:hypothetical protein
MKRQFVLLMTILVVLVPESISQANTGFLVDFSAKSTNPSDGNYWNIISAPSGTYELSDSSGSDLLQISLKITDSFSDTGDTTCGYIPSGDAAWAVEAGLDYIWISGENQRGAFDITGLSDTFSCIIEIYSGNSRFPDNTDYKVNGMYSDNGNSDNFNPLGNSTEVMYWGNVVPISGTITVVVDEWKGLGTSSLNAMRLTVVPEPATLLLLGLGAVMLKRKR